MAFAAGAITGTLGLDASPQVQAIKTAVAGAKEYREAMTNAANEAAEAVQHSARKSESAAKEMAENIKHSLGKRSAFGEWTEILAGGGALMGLNMAAHEFGEMVEKMGELNQQLEEGKINGFDMAEGIAQSLPVFGQFYKLGREIRDVFTGEKADMEETKRIVEEQNAALQERTRLIKEGKEAQKGFNDELRSLDQQLALLHASDKDSRDSIAANQDAENVKRKAEEDYKTKGVEPWKKAQKDLDDAEKERREKQAAADEIKPRWAESTYKRTEWEAAQKEADEATRKATEAKQALQDAQANAKKMYQEGQGIGAAADEINAAKQKEIADRPLKEAQEAKKRADEALRTAQDDALRPMREAQKETEQIGMTETQKKMDDLRRSAILFDPANLAEAQKVFDAYDAAVKNKEMDDRVKEIRESIETPLDKYNKAIKELNDLRAAGKLTDHELATASAKAKTDAIGPAKNPALIRSGSAESMAARYDGLRQNGQTPEQVQIKQLAATLSLERSLNNAASALRGRGPTETSNLPGVA